MEFRTKIEIKQSNIEIKHRSKIMMLGSCFAQNIGDKLLNNKFSANINPFGILYNPASISTVIRRIMNGKPFTSEDIKECKQIFVSLLHHGSFSALKREECLHNINQSLRQAIEDLTQCDLIITTFGTSYIYKLIETDEIVSNCHKFPSSMFQRSRLSIDEIVSDWSLLISQLRSINPKIKILFTISPVRHWKDGAHENQISKSILLVATDVIQKQFDEIEYFPSYEILMDELRDYRFYNDDMIHPNTKAIDYIWEVFSNTYFDNTTKNICNEWNKISNALSHKSFNPDSDSHKVFLRQTLLTIQDFHNKYPYIDCIKDEANLKSRLV